MIFRHFAQLFFWDRPVAPETDRLAQHQAMGEINLALRCQPGALFNGGHSETLPARPLLEP
jgi:hypothetical protein